MSDQRISTPATGQTGQAAGTGAARQVLEGTLPDGTTVLPDARLRTAFLTQSFVWMFVGLIVSAAIAYFVQSNDNLLRFAYNNTFLLIIAQVGLVVAISWGIKKISAIVALTLFFVYAASMGLTLGVIIAAYAAAGQSASVVNAFLAAAAMFGAAAIYGAVTKRSLAKMGGILFMGLIGLLVAMLLNIFLQSTPLTFLISIVGVVIFTGLTAWDVQRIQNGQLAIYTGSMEKAAVIGALTLYLDFINIFLFLLRLFGGNR
jgi:uncharacterized protein